MESGFVKGSLFVLVLLYIISPVDLVPGPIDDFLLLLFSVAYFVYRGLGYNNISYFELIAIQITVQMTIEMFPIPGGALMSETMLRDAFTSIFGIGIAEVGMLFTRTFAFYIPLIVCFIIIMIIVIKNREKYLNS